MKVPFNEVNVHVPARFYLKRALIALLVVGFLCLAVGGFIGYGIARTSLRPTAGPAAVTTTANRPIAARSLYAPAMPVRLAMCGPDRWFDRMAAIPVSAHARFDASLKVIELNSRWRQYTHEYHDLPAAEFGYEARSQACASIVRSVAYNAIIVWAGPFASNTVAKRFCATMGFRLTKRGQWDCDPVQAG